MDVVLGVTAILDGVANPEMELRLDVWLMLDTELRQEMELTALWLDVEARLTLLPPLRPEVEWPDTKLLAVVDLPEDWETFAMDDLD